jgi:hypothetical protein
MDLQRIVWLVGRIFFYSLLFLFLGIVIYMLSHDLFLGGLIFGVLFVLVVYKGLICITIPAYSLVVRDNKVVFFIREKVVRNRFDFVSRGQIIFELPHYSLLDRPYSLELFFTENDGNLYACRLSLYLDYDLEISALQKAYDSIIVHRERLSVEVRKLLSKSAACLVCQSAPLQSEAAKEEYVKQLVVAFNRGLESVGLKVEEAKCSFTSGSTLVRFVAAEQEVLEKSIAGEVTAAVK